MGRSVCIAYGHGCPRSRIDTAKLFPYFEANGWRIVDAVEDADIILVATCGVDASSEETSMAIVGQVDARRRSDAKLIVIGCLAGINEARVLDAFDAIVLPPVRLDELDAIIEARVKIADITDPGYVQPVIERATRAVTGRGGAGMLDLLRPLARTALRGLRTSGEPGGDNLEPKGRVFDLRVAHGCEGHCTYCAIKFAAGPLRSKPLEQIAAELRAALDEGFTQIRVVAGDIGCYGQDIGLSLADLLRVLFEPADAFEMTFLDIGPEWLVRCADEAIPLLAANVGRIRLLMMPVQSGSDRILRLMQRRYTSDALRDVLGRLRAEAPGILIATHIIVGFPGESHEDFEETVGLLRDVKLDRIDVYVYGDRPKTEARLMRGKVREDMKATRARRLREEFNARVQNYTLDS